MATRVLRAKPGVPRHEITRWDARKLVPRNASLDEIKQAFGPCQKVSGVKGGVFFNCDTGVTLGCDFAETGKFVQIRLKRR
jgi:hypothetical protein